MNSKYKSASDFNLSAIYKSFFPSFSAVTCRFQIVLSSFFESMTLFFSLFITVNEL